MQVAVQREVDGLAINLAYLANLIQDGSADSVQVMLATQQLRARYKDGELAHSRSLFHLRCCG